MVRLLCLHAITKGCTLESTVCQISVQKVFEALVKEKKKILDVATPASKHRERNRGEKETKIFLTDTLLAPSFAVTHEAGLLDPIRTSLWLSPVSGN